MGTAAPRLPPPAASAHQREAIAYGFDDEGKVGATHPLPQGRARASPGAPSNGRPKFGDGMKEDTGSRLTTGSTEEIFLERQGAPGSKAEEPAACGDPLARSSKGGAVRMACSTCRKKGDDWASKCPYLAPPPEGGYPPPAPIIWQAPDRIGDDVTWIMYDDRCVRVTNLLEGTREPDLDQLFSVFGIVSRVYVPLDEKTGSGRGVGFVKFARRQEAEDAIRKLNGHTYDNLVLQVGWAAPGGAVKEACPPFLRQAVDRSGDDVTRIKYDHSTVCVTNLSEDTREPDLRELFCLFGSVSRVYVPVDEKTGSGRGFGFVKFAQRQDAEDAIRRLNGWTYDNRILQVEWAAPKRNGTSF